MCFIGAVEETARIALRGKWRWRDRTDEMEGWIGSSRVAFVSTFNKTGMSNGTPEKQLVTLIGILTTKCGHMFKLN